MNLFKRDEKAGYAGRMDRGIPKSLRGFVEKTKIANTVVSVLSALTSVSLLAFSGLMFVSSTGVSSGSPIVAGSPISTALLILGCLIPVVVFYGEGIDRKAWSNARSALFYADELWCVGASLEVHPAADLPRMAVSLGKTVRVVSTGVVNIEGVKPAAWEKVTATADDAVPKLVDMVLGSGGD